MALTWDTWLGGAVCVACRPFSFLPEALQRVLHVSPMTLEEEYLWIVCCPDCDEYVPIQAETIPNSVRTVIIERIRKRKRAIASAMEVRL